MVIMCSHHRINQMAFERQDTCLVNLMVELFDCMEVVFLNWYWKWQAITAWHFIWITYQLVSSYMESYYKISKIYCCIRSAFKIYWISFFTTRQAVTHLGEKKEQFKKLYDVFGVSGRRKRRGTKKAGNTVDIEGLNEVRNKYAFQ